VVAADRTVGHLIRYLKTHQLYDSSTIILVADHGQGLGDHGEHQHGLFVYDEVLRVPLVIKQAAGEGAGRRVTEPVQHVDLVPTILDLAKAPVSGNLSGRSLKPVLDGNGRLGRRMIYSESLYGRYHFGWSELTSITDGRYRYIRAPREELYDLQLDPNQKENIASAAPGSIIDPLRHDLKQFGAGVAIPQPSEISEDERESFEALGFVGSGPDVQPAMPYDPKDKIGLVETYRTAVRLGVGRQWAAAIDLLRTALREKPERTDIWRRLAIFAGRLGEHEQSSAAYRRILALAPYDAAAHLGAARSLFKLHQLDEARQQAALVVEPGSGATSEEQVSAHTLLAEIALTGRDADTAREEARLVRETDSRVPMPDYVEARLLYDRGNLVDALPIFEQAVAESKGPQGGPIPGLHYYFGEALRRLKREAEAEHAFLEEIEQFPQNSRGRVALATIYANTDRMDEAGDTISELVRVSPTPETYRLAANLWETFGDSRQAAAVRAEARRRLVEPKAAGRSAQ
jgi:tetratricopeptide (TPR) repeat protein